MAPLRLSVARLSAEGLGASLVARLVRLAPGGTTTAEQRRVVVPGRGELRLDLTPGRWLLEATLPSGESLSESFEVEATQTGHVELGAREAGPDVLGWQALLGAVGTPGSGAGARAFGRGRRQAEPLPGPHDSRALEAGEQATPAWAPDPKSDHLDGPKILGNPWDDEERTRDAAPRDRGWGTLDETLRDGRRLPVGRGIEALQPASGSLPAFPQPSALTLVSLAGWRAAALTEALRSAGPSVTLAPSWYAAQDHDGIEQHVFAASVPSVVARPPLALVSCPGGEPASPAWVAALPWPWPGIGHEPPAAVEALIAGPRVSIAVRDARFGPALGYLAAGDLTSAALLIDDVATHVFERLENPLAAAAVGYILLGEWQRAAWESQAARPVWLDWTDALMRQAAWLPDGAILRGWLELRGRAGEPDLRQARVALLTALERGLPYYAAGVRRLYDGLTLLRQAEHLGDDRELARAHAEARWLSLRIDPRQAFTVVRLHDA